MDYFTKITAAFEQGGLWMWVILALQLVSFAIILERMIELYFRRRLGEAKIAEGFEEMVRKGDIEAVYNQSRNLETKHPVARAISAGSKAAMSLGGRNEIQGKMDEVLLKENSALEKRAGFLAVIGNVATLTGLLGTITGMIKAFAAVAYASPTEKATLLSTGISEAMNTTAYGLIVAIPALLMYAVIQNRGTQLAEDLNHGALKAFNWLSYNFAPVRMAQKAAAELRQSKAQSKAE